MSSGILTNWYISKISKAKTMVEYLSAIREFMLYSMNVANFNMREYFSKISGK